MRTDSLALSGLVMFLGGTSLAAMLAGCAAPPREEPESLALGSERTSFRADLDLLRGRYQVIELSAGQGHIVVAPELQGRVMTSGFVADGPSLGWINAEAVAQGERDAPFNDYGGQDRLWLGPEGGQFALFFDAAGLQNVNTWRVPQALNQGGFNVVAHNESSVRMQRAVELTNAAGTRISLQVERTVRAIPRLDAGRLLDARLPESLAYVGFVSENRIINTGPAPLTRESGAVSLWSAGQFPAGDQTVVILPFRDNGEGPRLTTYFSESPGAEHYKIDGETGVVLFRAHGRQHFKIGLPPDQTTGNLASIDLAAGILTIVQFDPTPQAKEFVNFTWQVPQTQPFEGDVAFVYNGPSSQGQRVYGLETCSPAAFLAPGASLAHHHRTLQFAGPLEVLSHISQSVLGVSLERVRSLMS